MGAGWFYLQKTHSRLLHKFTPLCTLLCLCLPPDLGEVDESVWCVHCPCWPISSDQRHLTLLLQGALQWLVQPSAAWQTVTLIRLHCGEVHRYCTPGNLTSLSGWDLLADVATAV